MLAERGQRVEVEVDVDKAAMGVGGERQVRPVGGLLLYLLLYVLLYLLLYLLLYCQRYTLSSSGGECSESRTYIYIYLSLYISLYISIYINHASPILQKKNFTSCDGKIHFVQCGT
jgi:hypothetical protein